MQALVLDGVVQVGDDGPRVAKFAAYPAAGYEVEYSMLAVTIVRTEAAAEDSLAAILARNRFGIAIATMIRMIATTISNSINKKPFCLRIFCFSLFFCCFRISVSTTRCLYSRTSLATAKVTKGCYHFATLAPYFQ